MKGMPPSISVEVGHNRDGPLCVMHRGLARQTISKDSLYVKRENHRSQSGFTLIELIVIVVVIGFLMVIATLNFRQMVNKSTIESNSKEIQALLMRARNDASTTNIQRVVTLAPNQIQVTSDTDGDGVFDAGEPTLTYPFRQFALQFAISPIVFDRRGIANTVANQTLQVVHPGNVTPMTDCIVVFATRINIGLMTGGVCAEQ